MKRIGMNVDKVLDVAKTIVTVRVNMPQKRGTLLKDLVPYGGLSTYQTVIRHE